MEIFYIDREDGKIKSEVMAGEKWLRLIYETRVGRGLLELIVKRKWFSEIYGRQQDKPSSTKKINDFVELLSIDMSEAQISDIKDYKSFNDFFTRRLKPEARPLDMSSNVIISPADGKILAYTDIDPKKLVQIKDFNYSLDELVGDENLAEIYRGGVCLVIRLAPADYHRFHFPDAGVADVSSIVTGDYYSVNPLSLITIAKLYCRNKRSLTKFYSDNFGKMLLLEVGATCVGSIVQTYTPGVHIIKGAEKGFFKFGGSTVIVFLEPGYLQVDNDILANTAQGYETKIKMGEAIGSKIA